MTVPSSVSALGLSVGLFQPLVLGGAYVDNYSDEVVSYTHELAADNFYNSAEIVLQLRDIDLTEWLLSGLGRHVRVKSPSQAIIWEGFVDSLTVSYGGKVYTVGPLSDIGNRVYVTHTPLYVASSTGFQTRGTSTESAVVNDTTSQALYGIIEKNLMAGECIITATLNEASNLRAAFLAENTYPKVQGSYSFGGGGSAAEVTLNCLGYWKWLDFYIYNFRINNTSFGYVNLNTKVQTVLAANPNTAIFSTDYSGLSANTAVGCKQEQNNRTALAIIKGITAAGDPSGNRWLFGFGEGRKAYYKPIPTTPVYEYKVYDNEQRMTVYGSDTPISPWDIAPGQWYETTDTLKPITRGSIYSIPTAAFIESIKYVAPYGFDLTEGKWSKIGQMLNMKGLGSI
ncbi:MAG: hypothetical protein LUQ37_05850 [Methanoregulaceae archaeon]|jgi:hypothetical protein|nr:hypothetical protein [Methanoregulaceae archaeon]